MALNERQRIWLDHYMISFNATDAARKAGYSEKSAGVQGSRLKHLPHMVDEIEKRMQKIHEKINVTPERVVQSWPV